MLTIRKHRSLLVPQLTTEGAKFSSNSVKNSCGYTKAVSQSSPRKIAWVVFTLAFDQVDACGYTLIKLPEETVKLYPIAI